MLALVWARSLTTLFALSSTVGGGGDKVAFRTMDKQALAMDGGSLVLGDSSGSRSRGRDDVCGG